MTFPATHNSWDQQARPAYLRSPLQLLHTVLYMDQRCYCIIRTAPVPRIATHIRDHDSSLLGLVLICESNYLVGGAAKVVV